MVIDVRRLSDRSHDPVQLPGAVWKDPEKVAEWAGQLEGRETVIYCVRGGSVSRSVQEQLRRKNVTVRFIEGGLEAWNKAGKPVERPGL